MFDLPEHCVTFWEHDLTFSEHCLTFQNHCLTFREHCLTFLYCLTFWDQGLALMECCLMGSTEVFFTPIMVVCVTQQSFILWYYPAMLSNLRNMSEHSSSQYKTCNSSVTYWFINKNIAWLPTFSSLILECQADSEWCSTYFCSIIFITVWYVKSKHQAAEIRHFHLYWV